MEKTINLGFGSIYRKVKDYRQIYQGDQYMQMIHKLQSSSNYRLQVAAEDAHHCEGYLADIYIKSSAYIIIITIIFTMINSVFLLKEATLADDLAVYNTYSKVTTMFLLYLWRKKSKK